MDEAFKKSSTRDTFESLVVTVILAIFGTTFVLQAFKIPTGSMEDTLLIGDHLLVNKFIFAPQDGVLAHFLPYRELASWRRGGVQVRAHRRADGTRRALCEARDWPSRRPYSNLPPPGLCEWEIAG